MKKSLIALAVLGTVSAVASAQSSVTLYGVLDLSARYTDNGKETQKALASGGMASSRWGIRGTESISDDLSASFVLESGLNADTGANSDSARMFNRRATVSLTSKKFGEVRLGRDKTPVYTAQEAFDPFTATGSSIATVTNLIPSLSNQKTTSRADNQVQYFLPKIGGGFYGQYSAAAVDAVSEAGNSMRSARAGYAAGPLNVSVAVARTKVTALNGNDTVDEMLFGVSYNMGFATLSAMAEKREFPAAAGTISNGSNTRNHDVVLLGASAPVGKDGTARLAFSKLNDNSAAEDGAAQFALGYSHNLSKRTSIYTNFATISNDEKAAYSAAGGHGAAGVAGKTYRALDVGVRHTF